MYFYYYYILLILAFKFFFLTFNLLENLLSKNLTLIFYIFFKKQLIIGKFLERNIIQ